MESYIVYVKTNSNGYIINVLSSAFLTDTQGWTEIDSGQGDKYHYAQRSYFSKPIVTENGAWQYRLVGGVPVECSAEEIAEQEAALQEPEEPMSVWDELDKAYQEGVDSV